QEVRTLRIGSSTVAFCSDGQMVIPTAGHGLALWDVTAQKEPRLFAGPPHSDEIGCLAISRDGKTVASAGRDKTVKLWDLTSGKELATLKGHSDWVDAVAFNPDDGETPYLVAMGW